MKSTAVKHTLLAMAAALALASCGDQEVILEGERLDIAGEARADLVNRALPLALPRAARNGSWTQVGGNGQHHLAHVALAANPSRIWSAQLGEGNSRKHRITADPVVGGGRVYGMDSTAQVRAFTTSGAPLWSANLTPASESARDASGGGLALGDGALFATTGFGEITALSAATGARRWVQKLESAATGAPTYHDGVVYLVTRNNIGWALDARTGRILWQALGADSRNGVAGGAAPAIAGEQVIFPLSSGQLVGAAQGTGERSWLASIAGERRGRAFSRFSDLTGEPVVAGGVVYAGNHSGRAAAFDAATGQRIWRANEGALSPVAVAGGSVFLVSDENRLIRLDAATGETIWAVNLPFFERSRIARREATVSHFGPVLAGGRLLLVSNDGVVRRFDPVSGRLTSSFGLGKGAARNPVIANGTLYIVTENGQLHAFR